MRTSLRVTVASCGLACGLIVLTPARVSAQWYLDTYTGANYTAPADVRIDQPDLQTALDFHDVHFDAKPFKSPQYYGLRVGRFLGHSGWAIEAEFLHLKVISRTADSVHISGTLDNVPIDTTAPMIGIVQRYNMTHGLNFLVANLARRVPLRGATGAHPAVVFLRAGVGLTRPGVDDEVDGGFVEGYEFAGRGADAGADLEVRVAGRLSALSEYKVTFARPRIQVTGGHGEMSAFTQSVTAGIGIRLFR